MNRMSRGSALCVVIPTRNRARSVVRAVRSVLATARRDIDVIVVDDASQDDTRARLAVIRDPRLQWWRTSLGGASRARNLGAARSDAGLIAFLDSDDVFLPGRVDRLIGFFETHASVDCLIDGFVEASQQRRHVHRMPRSTPNKEGIRRLLLAHQVPLSNSAITVRRTAWQDINGHDEELTLHDDRDFLLRLAARHTLCFGRATDMIKYRSGDSISRVSDGYVDGLDALAARHADYHQPAFADLFRYLIVRGILTCLIRGHLFAALREFRRLRAAKHLPRDFLYAVSRYRAGRRQRRMPHAGACSGTADCQLDRQALLETAGTTDLN